MSIVTITFTNINTNCMTNVSVKKELYRNCDTGHSCYSKKTNIIENQGFKPSDCQDNIKKQFLIDLSKQMWIKDCVSCPIFD